MNIATSLLSGVVVFSVMGFLAKLRGVSVSEVAESGKANELLGVPHTCSFAFAVSTSKNANTMSSIDPQSLFVS